ncbi:MAG: penicillin-binding protein activator [Pseudomonadota bacterium]
MGEGRAVGKTNRFFAAPFAAICALTLLLAACAGGEGPAPAIVQTPGVPLPTEERVIGDGNVTVAMLLPLSAGGSASNLAQSFQNAADLALAEVNPDNVRILVLDTGGETDKARLAAEAAIAGGAQLILGPVFAPAVTGAGTAARAANVPMVAFSTDASVTGRGVYLLSFLPRQDATRIARYAGEQGLRAFAGLVPDNGYGLVMEAAFREAVAASGGRVTAIERYASGEIGAAAGRLASRGAFEAVFVPNGGDDPTAAAAALRAQGINARLLGSGQWDNPAVWSGEGLAGAWFPAPQKGGFEAFSQRYQAKYSGTPPRTASLVYDAALLANGLAGIQGGGAYRPATLEGRDGYVGVDGVFRLTGNGLSERGLAVYEIKLGGSTELISPAPKSFGRSF